MNQIAVFQLATYN